MPVHTVYAVPKGRVRIENDNSRKLAIIVTIVIAEGTNLVNPPDC